MRQLVVQPADEETGLQSGQRDQSFWHEGPTCFHTTKCILAIPFLLTSA